jgi:hypothetical protein
MKPRHLLLGAALLGAAALAAFGDRTPRDDVAEAVERPAPRVPASARTPGALPAPAGTRAAALLVPTVPARRAGPDAAPAAPMARGQAILALVPRESLIGDSDTQFAQAENSAGAAAGAGAAGQGDPFGRHDWTPPPPPPAPAAPVPPPSAPPLPFTFIGKSVADGAWEVYLTRGERTYVVHDKETIDGTYHVDAIAPPVLTLTYLPLKQIQQLNIGVFD